MSSLSESIYSQTMKLYFVISSACRYSKRFRDRAGSVHAIPMVFFCKFNKGLITAGEASSLKELQWDTSTGIATVIPARQKTSQLSLRPLFRASPHGAAVSFELPKKEVHANYTWNAGNNPLCGRLFEPFLQKYLRQLGSGTDGFELSKVTQLDSETYKPHFS